MYLSSNRSQMTSKCDENNQVAFEVVAEPISYVLATFWHHLWSINEQTHDNMESILFNKEPNKFMKSSVRPSSNRP